MKKTLLFVLLILTLSISKVDAASVSFYTSGGGQVYTGSQVSVVVYANSDDAYNAVNVNVSYSNMTLLGMSVDGGWTGVSGPSDSGGTVSFSGALLGSSATGSHAVLDLTFRVPYSDTQSSITSSGNIALADGNGTIVSGGGNTASYNVVNPPPAAPTVPDKVNISSTSHPDQTKWAKSTHVDISWNKQDGVDGFSYIFDTDPNSVPDETSESTETAKIYDTAQPGTNYFHIRAHNATGWSEQSVYSILYDNKSPDPFGLAKLENDAQDKYLIYFATNDSLSGVDYFTVTVDGVDLGKQVTGYAVNKDVGKVEVTAFDKVGNSITEELVINEKPVSDVPQTSNSSIQPDSRILIVLGGLVLVSALAALTYYLYKRKTRKKISFGEAIPAT